MGQEVMGGTAEGVVVEAKPNHRSHLSHWTKSWNLESQPRSCLTQTHPDLGEGSPHWADTVAPGPPLTGTPCADEGGSGGGVGGGVGKRTMYVSGGICVCAFHNGLFGLRMRSLAWVPARVPARLAGQPRLG